jgi:hypothetical protein
VPSWLRVTRDGLIATAAVALLAYEIILGGARPAVLTALTSLLLSPVVLRADEARRARGNTKEEPPL